MTTQSQTLRGIFIGISLLLLTACGGGGGVPPPPSGITARQIATGSNHTCALLDNATVKCWGENSFGRLGQGDTNDRGDVSGEMGKNLLAIDLGSGRTATQIAAGDFHTCALLDNATVKCWGENSSGQLGQGDTNARGDGPGEMGDLLPPVELESP